MNFETKYAEFKEKFTYLANKCGIPVACLVIHTTAGEARFLGDAQLVKILSNTLFAANEENWHQSQQQIQSDGISGDNQNITK